MSLSLPRVFRRRRHNYRAVMTENERAQLRDVLAQPGQLERGYLVRVHEQTGIPISNLKRWRRMLLGGVDPFRSPPRRPHYGVPREAEEEIFQELTRLLETQQFCPRVLVRSVAIAIGRRFNPNFRAGRKWLRSFLRRYGLSFRVAHPRRRTAPNDQVVANFLQELEVALVQLPPSLILNMDETAWRLYNGQLTTLARRGADEVMTCSRLDEKSNITVICTVTLDGKKLPPWAIIKGKTEKCEERYRKDPRMRSVLGSKKLFLTHSESGWATKHVMKLYIKWLADQVGHCWCYLIWDLHSSHRHPSVKEKAARENVNLSYIPAGQTGTLQPLDAGVFGPLKSHATNLLNIACTHRPLSELDMVDALLILVQAWSELSEDAIARGWNRLYCLQPAAVDEPRPQSEQGVALPEAYSQGLEHEEEEEEDEEYYE